MCSEEKKIKYPKMILFDYGHTLLYEPGWDAVKGNAELLKYAVKNPDHCTLEDVRKGAELIFGKHIESVRKMGYDISGQVGDKVLYEYLGIEFSLTPLEMETVFWNGASMGAIMPDADRMLDYINRNGIRSGVISNLLWSGAALTDRLGRLLPENQFEFVMTSSDYFVRKPNRILFDIALKKAGVCADEVWYCGDNPKADVEGASQAGIYPVWYDNDTGKDDKDRSDEHAPACEHLHIHDWNEMIDLLERLKTEK
ncbi:MAG: HAD family hydrolase [Lachnospiraceae bacterium]|nr:HAD family hydrolase [Lachnospiraceae bacterium]